MIKCNSASSRVQVSLNTHSTFTIIKCTFICGQDCNNLVADGFGMHYPFFSTCLLTLWSVILCNSYCSWYPVGLSSSSALVIASVSIVWQGTSTTIPTYAYHCVHGTSYNYLCTQCIHWAIPTSLDFFLEIFLWRLVSNCFLHKKIIVAALYYNLKTRTKKYTGECKQYKLTHVKTITVKFDVHVLVILVEANERCCSTKSLMVITNSCTSSVWD